MSLGAMPSFHQTPNTDSASPIMYPCYQHVLVTRKGCPLTLAIPGGAEDYQEEQMGLNKGQAITMAGVAFLLFLFLFS